MRAALEQRRWLRIAAAIGSGLLFYSALGLEPLWWEAWLAPVPILLAAFCSPTAREAALLAYLSVAIGVSSNAQYYLKTTGPAAAPVLLILIVLLWGFFIGRTRSFVRTSRSGLVMFSFPVLLAGTNTLISVFSPHGTAGSYVYSQMEALPVIQIASIAGGPAIIFTVALFASTVAIAIYRGAAIKHPWRAYCLPIAIVALVLGFGLWRLKYSDGDSRVPIGLASVDDFISSRAPRNISAVWSRYEKLIDELSHNGAKIIVLPEKIQALSPAEADLRRSDLAQLARRDRVYLVVGVQLDHPKQKDNALWLFDPDQGLVCEYHKQHLVPYLESSLTPGRENMTRVVAGSRCGLTICRDLLFTRLGREYGRLGISLMLVPAWDFYVDAWMASGEAALRGVESGYSVVRAGRESDLSMTDRYGRVLARRRSDFLPGSSLLADVPMGPAKTTFYARHGDWFGWLCVSGLALILLGPMRVRKLFGASFGRISLTQN